MIIGEEEMKNERQLLTVEDGPLMQGRESVRYLILHCSATRCDKDYTAEQLLRDHKTRGFRTVGYHFYIRRDGTITQHRKLLEVGAHCLLNQFTEEISPFFHMFQPRNHTHTCVHIHNHIYTHSYSFLNSNQCY